MQNDIDQKKQDYRSHFQLKQFVEIKKKKKN